MRVHLPKAQQAPPLWYQEAERSPAQKVLFSGGFRHPLTNVGGRTFHRDVQSLTSVDPDPARSCFLLFHFLSPAMCIVLIPLGEHHAQS